MTESTRKIGKAAVETSARLWKTWLFWRLIKLMTSCSLKRNNKPILKSVQSLNSLKTESGALFLSIQLSMLWLQSTVGTFVYYSPNFERKRLSKFLHSLLRWNKYHSKLAPLSLVAHFIVDFCVLTIANKHFVTPDWAISPIKSFLLNGMPTC